MENEQNQVPENSEKLKEIPKWARKYAQNRTLTILVLLVIVGLYSMLIAFLVAFPLAITTTGFKRGNMVLGFIGIAVLIAVIVAVVRFNIFIFSKYGGKNKETLDQKIDRWIYGREGNASISMPEAGKKKKWLEIIVVVVWVSLFFGTMYLGMIDFIPARYMQPISALYCIPYMIFAWYFLQSPRMGSIFLLKPTLYAIHAILIVSGVPIFFTGRNVVVLNMVLPLLGYGYLTLIIGHLYSRYALKKLKGIAHPDGGTFNGD